MKISFIIPCYRSATTIEAVVSDIDEVADTLDNYDHEIILVNDCSPDNTMEAIRKLCQEKSHLIGIGLARNFGQHAALMAGFRQASGQIIVCLDDDGQTPALEVGKLLKALEAGADAVYAKYELKYHGLLRRMGSRLNDLMTRMMLGKPKNLYISSYFAVKGFIAEEIKKYEGAYPYVIGLVLRTTRNIVNVEVEHHERTSGESGYTLSKLFSLWLKGFTSFSIKPLRLATMLGVFIAGIGFVYAAYIIINRLFLQPNVLTTGIASIISALLVIGGLILVMLGMIGEYIGRMYINMNSSPQYVVREMIPPEMS